MIHNKLKISIICWYAYPVYVPSYKARIGGAEFTSALIARQLAKNEQFEVSAIVDENLAGEPVTVDGVHVVPLPYSPKPHFLEKNLIITGTMVKRISRFPWIKLCNPRLSLLWRLPLAVPFQLYKHQFDNNRRRAKFQRKYLHHQSDIILTFCRDKENANAIISCQKMKRRSILMLMEDGDISARNALPSNVPPGDGQSVVAWNQALMTADVVIAQTPYQQRTLKERFGRDSQLVHTPIEVGS